MWDERWKPIYWPMGQNEGFMRKNIKQRGKPLQAEIFRARCCDVGAHRCLGLRQQILDHLAKMND